MTDVGNVHYALKLVTVVFEHSSKYIHKDISAQIAYMRVAIDRRSATIHNIGKPEVIAKATDHIAEMIKDVQILLDKGYAYEIEAIDRRSATIHSYFSFFYRDKVFLLSCKSVINFYTTTSA